MPRIPPPHVPPPHTGLKDPSALFRHDVAFCLGQRQDPAAIAALQALLRCPTEHPMVRHEAGEALGAIGTEPCLVPLREHVHDPCMEVAQTCQLALQRIDFLERRRREEESEEEGKGGEDASRFMSVDPTPPAPSSTPLSDLHSALVDDDRLIFERYRALFALRNKGGDEAVAAMAASFASCSALLKHEVAYVLGQLQDPASVETLK
jgi:deoxyhypusine monooxygenase